MKILIKNGRLIDPAQDLDEKGDLLIEKGKIAKAGGTINESGAEIIDAEGCIVAPGLIDMHTHLREPGKEEAETIETGMKAATAGGFTTVCAMPNTDPPCDTQADARFIRDRALEAKLGRVLPVGTITRGRRGEQLTDMGELKEAGCLSVSDDGASVEDPELMRRALEYAAMLDLLVISHCEDKKLAADGVMHEGYWSTVLGLKPIPAASESAVVEREVRLAELADARIHIAHVSSAESVEIIRQAKKRGIKVTAEVTPHHLTLIDEDLKGYDTNFKVNPPLRTREDIKALKKAVKDGTIDVIATDHAPHPENEKQKEFDYAPFGMIGLETALALSVKALIDEGHLDWSGVISKLSTRPAEILGTEGGTLKQGSSADVIVIDPGKEWEYSRASVRSKSHNSPFIGWKLKAQVRDVVAAGKIILKAGELAGK